MKSGPCWRYFTVLPTPPPEQSRSRAALRGAAWGGWARGPTAEEHPV